jgi:single-strand DNA-binding protein
MSLGQWAGELRLGTDPDLRYTAGGKAICNFRAVSSTRRKNPQTNEWEDDEAKTTWVTCEVWDTHGENVAESLVKGDAIVVVGRFYVNRWTNDKGEERLTPTIIVEHIGPALRWATAKPVKASRSNAGGLAQGGQAQQGPPADDPWAAPTTGLQPDEPPF